MSTDLEKFDKQLEELLDEMDGGELLAIPGLYAVVSEHLNNEVLAALKENEEEDLARAASDDPVGFDEDLEMKKQQKPVKTRPRR